MKRKVVIIGNSYSSRLSLTRAIGQLDCDITLVIWDSIDKKPIDSYSKYVRVVLFCQKDEKTFLSLLIEKCADSVQKVLLVPICDFSVTVIDSHWEMLKPHFLMPHIRHQEGAIVKWMDKMRQNNLASSLGLNVAGSTVIDIKDGAYVIPEDLEYPCFPKALESVTGGKAAMFRCNGQDDLERALQDIITRKTPNARVMVENYMEIEEEYAVVGVSDGKNVCIPGVLKFIVGSKKQSGIALQGLIMPPTGFEHIIEKFKKLILEIGLVGLFDIDFYQSGGRLYFCELNVRWGASGYAVVKSGVNLAAMYIDSLCGKDIGITKSIERTSVFVNERIALNDLCSRLISVKQYRKYVRKADIMFIKDKDDPEPYKRFKKELNTATIKSLIKSFLHWKD